MKTLVILRHGKAEKTGFLESDFDRNLKKSGKEDVLNTAKKLSANNITPDLILTSPVVRAFQTTQLIANFYKSKPRVEAKRFLYCRLYSMLDIVDEIIGTDVEADVVFVVGHNPMLIRILGQILGNTPEHLSTASAYVIVFECNSWFETMSLKGTCMLKTEPESIE